MDLVEKDRHGDGAGGAQNDEGHIVQQGVTGNDPGILGGKQELKVFEADKGASPDPLAVVELLKGNHDARHGNVVVDNQVNSAWYHHQVKGDEPL